LWINVCMVVIEDHIAGNEYRPRAVAVLCDWEGNRRFTVAMRHRLCGILIHRPAQRPQQWSKHPAYDCIVSVLWAQAVASMLE